MSAAQDAIRSVIYPRPREVVNDYHPNLAALSERTGIDVEELYEAWRSLSKELADDMQWRGVSRRVA